MDILDRLEEMVRVKLNMEKAMIEGIRNNKELDAFFEEILHQSNSVCHGYFMVLGMIKSLRKEAGDV